MRVWVIRHAEAVHAAGRHDHDRELSATGQRQAVLLGRYLSRRTSATLIVSSPVLRARQTSEAIQASLPTAKIHTSDAFSPSGSAREAIVELKKHRVSECIVVSHEPLTSQLVARLTVGDDALHVRFAPATAVLLDMAGHGNAAPSQLLECISPEALQHAAEL